MTVSAEASRKGEAIIVINAGLKERRIGNLLQGCYGLDTVLPIKLTLKSGPSGGSVELCGATNRD